MHSRERKDQVERLGMLARVGMFKGQKGGKLDEIGVGRDQVMLGLLLC